MYMYKGIKRMKMEWKVPVKEKGNAEEHRLFTLSQNGSNWNSMFIVAPFVRLGFGGSANAENWEALGVGV